MQQDTRRLRQAGESMSISENTVNQRDEQLVPDLLSQNLIERVCVGDIITRSADVYPDRAAIVHGQRSLSYADLDRRVNQLGHALLGLGLGHQQVVGVMARNDLEILVTYFACARAGLICAPVNLGLRGPEIAYCLRDARARILIVEDALAEVAAELPAQLPDLEHVYWTGTDPHADLPKSAGTFEDLLASGSDAPLETLVYDRDPVQLLYTSGTTANPKGVLTSHLAVTMAGLSNAVAHGSMPGSRALITLPLFHCAMLNSAAVPILIAGGTLILVQAFDARQTAELIEQYQINMIVLLPMMYGQLVGEPSLQGRSFPSITRAIYAMAPMPDERLQAIHAMFPNADVVLGSGQTEFTPATCMQRPEHQWSKAASWGTATVMTRVAIMDDEGRLLPRGEMGEIVYRGPQVMNGYLNRPDATEESFRHGWFHSGDVAWIDDDGAIWFKDRNKDVIKTGGENVASIEVERCLLEHPVVADAAVVGLGHPRWGEAITAVVILKPGQVVDESTLIRHCQERLSGFKVPKSILFQEEFPRTGTGKIQKHVIRTQLKDFYQE